MGAAADKFLGLTYVKYKGQIIVRQRRVEKTTVKKSPVKKEKEDRKRKHPEINRAPSACIKLKGFKNPQTTFKSIQEALDRKGVKKFDIQFIQYKLESKEAVVTLRNEAVAGMALQLLSQQHFYINSDKIAAEQFSYTNNNSNNSNSKTLNKAKKLKSSENLQKPKNPMKGWFNY